MSPRLALALLAAVTHAAVAYLQPPVVTPSFVADVDANQYLTFTMTTVAVGAYAYNVNVTDVNAISPSNYTVSWIRINPSSPNLPEPPVLSQYDPSLIYVQGDFNPPYAVRGAVVGSACVWVAPIPGRAGGEVAGEARAACRTPC